ncbi:MAG: hypothetical protein V3S43_00095 [Acidimicrobiia bacterium]
MPDTVDQRRGRLIAGELAMDIFFLLSGKDPNDKENREKTWIVVADSEIDARKALPGYFEVYEVEVRAGDLGELSGVIGWLGKARN